MVVSLLSKTLLAAARLLALPTAYLEGAIASPLFDLLVVVGGGSVVWWVVTRKLETLFRRVLRDIAGVARPRRPKEGGEG